VFALVNYFQPGKNILSLWQTLPAFWGSLTTPKIVNKIEKNTFTVKAFLFGSAEDAFNGQTAVLFMDVRYLRILCVANPSPGTCIIKLFTPVN
jgi:hypothetical protein